MVTLKEKVYTKVLGVYTRMKAMALTRTATKEDGYIEYIEYDLDSDSEAEEEERIYRIQRLFDDDGISDPEDEREEKVPSGYTQETTVENAFCWGCGVEWE